MSKITMDDVSVMGTSYFQYSLEYFLDSMYELGIKKIDLWGAEPLYTRLDWPSTAEAKQFFSKLRTELDARDQEIVIYTPETLGYPYNFSEPRPRQTKRTIEYFKWAFEDAHLMGCNRVFINSGCGLRNINREESFKICVETFSKILELAEKEDIIMPLEALQPYESNLVTTIDDIDRMIKEVGSDNLRVCVDLVAMEIQNENLDEYFKRFGDKVEWIHYSDSHHEILGKGTYGKEKLEGYIKTLEENDFMNGIDLEINDSIYWENPHQALKESVLYLQNVLNIN